MAVQLGTTLRNARGDQLETTIGTSPKLYIYSGAQPANCAAADPSGLLATINLPSDFLSAASGGVKSLAGSWTTTASAAGTAASWRIKDNAGSVCHMQGTVTATGGGGDLTLDNTSIASGQTVTINTFTITEGGA